MLFPTSLAVTVTATLLSLTEAIELSKRTDVSLFNHNLTQILLLSADHFRRAQHGSSHWIPHGNHRYCLRPKEIDYGNGQVLFK